MQLTCVCSCHGQVCHTGDALADDAVVPGGFAGIVVDLFADGQILPALCEVRFWCFDVPTTLSVWELHAIISLACTVYWRSPQGVTDDGSLGDDCGSAWSVKTAGARGVGRGAWGRHAGTLHLASYQLPICHLSQ